MCGCPAVISTFELILLKAVGVMSRWVHWALFFCDNVVYTRIMLCARQAMLMLQLYRGRKWSPRLQENRDWDVDEYAAQPFVVLKIAQEKRCG